MVEPPLAGLRVLELASGVAGPYAGRLLAMLGATVCKVEPPGGDPARTKQVDDVALDGLSPLYVHLNAGKLNAAGGRARRLRRRHRRAAGVDAALLVTVTPFGFDAGPGAIEHDVLAQARSGLIGVQGDPANRRYACPAGRRSTRPARPPRWPRSPRCGCPACATSTCRGPRA